MSNIIQLGDRERKTLEGMKLLEQRAAIETMPAGSEAKGLRLIEWAAAFREYAKRYGMTPIAPAGLPFR